MFIRTRDSREVDFAIIDDEMLKTLIEVKTSDTAPSHTLTYLGTRHIVEMVQIVKDMPHQELRINDVRVVRMREYLEGLSI